MKFLVSVYPWENPILYESDLELKDKDKVIVPSEFANELGIIFQSNIETSEESRGKILRKATERDKEVFKEYEKEKKNILKIGREENKKLQLGIKLVDARMSLDGKQAIIAFTSEDRVDFRELVKNISKEIKKSVKMKQIGSRDEARRLGGFGICGRELCCVNFPGSIQSITTEMARVQQVSHRGTERISGLCGRLMCCLAYESQQYKDMLQGMPEMYSVLQTPEGKGTVVEVNAVTQEVKVKLENGKYISVKKKDL
jgi:cell fate regulator YaaT (PSP1 superfamily)